MHKPACTFETERPDPTKRAATESASDAEREREREKRARERQREREKERERKKERQGKREREREKRVSARKHTHTDALIHGPFAVFRHAVVARLHRPLLPPPCASAYLLPTKTDILREGDFDTHTHTHTHTHTTHAHTHTHTHTSACLLPTKNKHSQREDRHFFKI